MSNSLKQHLFNAYNGFSNKRVKNISKGDTFIVDDRTPRDEGSRGLYSYFCRITLTVHENEMCNLKLCNNVPFNDSIKNYVQSHHGIASRDSLSLSFSLEQTSILRKLAHLVEDITNPNTPRYDEPSYKYVCPRTASSLRNLADCLDSYKPGDRQLYLSIK